MIDLQELGMGPRKFLDARRRELEALDFSRIQVTPLAPVIGAEVHGVDLSQPLDDETFAEVERAFLEFKVVFFREQDLSAKQHLAFAERFGELEEHPFLPGGDEPEIVRFQKGEEMAGVENVWHSDVSWRLVPSLGSVLRAHHVPKVGGDTLWADMEAAYEGLSDGLKARIDGAVAIHDFANSFGLAMTPEKREAMREQYPPAEHPVVRTHPQTGRKCIYVNGIFTSHVKGLAPEESDELLRHLYRQASFPEYQVRFRWEPNSIAFWDNRSTQHYASSDYWPQERVMDRVTIIGDRPF